MAKDTKAKASESKSSRAKSASSAKSLPVVKAVPLFTKAELDIADLCARDLWRGKDFTSGKTQTSDEVLMGYFAPNFFKLRTGKRKKLGYLDDDIDALVKVGRISLFNNVANTSFPKGVLSIQNNLLPKYRLWKNHSAASVPAKMNSYGIDATKIISMDFVRYNTRKPYKHRISLASRLLFYVAPDMMLFNYSSNLSKAMGYRGQPQSILPKFAGAMEDGLIRNWKLLSSYELPFSYSLKFNQDVWQLARDNGWWQRRVLDLALLIHFVKVVPRPFLTNLLATTARYTP